VNFPNIAHIQDVMRVHNLVVKIDIDTESHGVVAQLVTSSPALEAWYWYFEYFELFQMAFVIHNHHLHMDDPLPGLHDNFAVLGPSRDFHENDMEYGIKQRDQTQLDSIIHDQDMKRNRQLPV
jgi:hypothetical protein